MKIAGKKIEGANTEVCVIPRGNGDDLVFTCQAVLDLEGFNKLCPVPTPPSVYKPGGKKYEDVESPVYKIKLEEHNKQRMNYMFLKSLEATKDLEWETVDISDPSTWANYPNELKESGLSEIEIGRIYSTFALANCLNEDRIEKAREAFLASAGMQANGQYSHKEEVASTQSGEPAKD